MPRIIVGHGPWRYTEGVAMEVWQDRSEGLDGTGGYSYNITAGAALAYAAACYREAMAVYDIVGAEYVGFSQYTREQADVIDRWFWLAREAKDQALLHLHRVALEG